MINENPKPDYSRKKNECSKPVIIALTIIALFTAIAIAISIYLLIRITAATNTVGELPLGTVLLYSGDSATLTRLTYRWLYCDGSEISRSTYRDLFNVIGIKYGSGNGIDTFNLPDFRARFPLGSNGSDGGQLVTGGASSHVLTVAEIPMHTHGPGSLQILPNGQHTHQHIDPGHNHGGSTGNGPNSYGSFGMVTTGGFARDGTVHSHTIPNGTTDITIQPNGNHTHILQGITDVEGASQPMDMMPPYQTIHYIIRA